MQHDLGPYGDCLSSLLAKLSAKTLGSPITSVVNETTINLMCNLLTRDPQDYVNIAERLSDDSDVEALLDFMLHLLRERGLPDSAGAVDINVRARRLMLKVAARTFVIPRSLMVTGGRIRSELSLIGSGGFGCVFKGKLGGVPVALKVLYKAHNNIDFRREALMWRSLNHNHVLPFLGIYEDESASFLVSPYMKNGTLAQWRKKRRPSIAEIEERILEVARGMKYIHSEGVVHGDLRGDNILLDPHLHVKIADFGLTRLSEATGSQAGALHLNFAAPELLGCSEDGDSDDVPARTQKSDVYAFGCLYYEIHYDSIPFSGRQEMQILRLISRGELPPRCDEPPLSDDAWSMIQSCWARQASKRPAMKDIVKWMRTTPDSDSYSLRLLLCMLKDKTPIRPIGSNVNKTTVGLMCKLLDSNDYTAISSELRLASDAELLLDFILCLFDKNYLQEHPTPDITRKARRFMFKLSAQRPVAPRSLFITGVVTPDLNQVDYIGKYKGKYVALKVLHRGPHLNASVKRDLCREVLAWRSLSHKYILPLLGIFKMESKTFLVSPYMENGTLAGWRSKRQPSVKDIRQRVLEVAEALRYIHSEGIVHGDLRGENILLDSSFHSQVADFGLTRQCDITLTLSTSALSLNFAAPELFGICLDSCGEGGLPRRKKTRQTDIYAFGCLYYQIYFDAVPFRESNQFQIMMHLVVGKRPERLETQRMEDDEWNLIQSCWHSIRSERPSVRDIVKTMTSIVHAGDDKRRTDWHNN